METIDETFYRIEGLVNLLKTGKLGERVPRRLWLRRMAFLENLNNYYRFSVSSVRLFQESVIGATENLSFQKKKEDLDDKSHSVAIMFYGHCRVCIESAGLLSEEAVFSANEHEAEAIQKHRDKYAPWAREMIQNRNAITAHPHNVRQMIVGCPSSWGTDGKVSFNTLNLEHIIVDRKEFELNPTEDLIKLRTYITETIEHLLKVYAID